MSHIISFDFVSSANCEAAETSRKLAQKQQEELVCHKERHSVQPIPGSLYKLRKERKEARIKLNSLGSLKVSI